MRSRTGRGIGGPGTRSRGQNDLARGCVVMTEAEDDAKRRAEAVAATLGLSFVRSFAHGIYGAALVAAPGGEELVLKTQPDPSLEPVWTVGAETAAVVHDRGYPNPRVLQVGSTGEAVWSLQERLAGHLIRRLTATHAEQLIALAGRHDTDSGRSRPWREDAIAAARRWLGATPIDPAPAHLLASAPRRLAIRSGHARLRLPRPPGRLRAGGGRPRHRGGPCRVPGRRGRPDDGLPGAADDVDDRRPLARRRRQGVRPHGRRPGPLAALTAEPGCEPTTTGRGGSARSRRPPGRGQPRCKSRRRTTGTPRSGWRGGRSTRPGSQAAGAPRGTLRRGGRPRGRSPPAASRRVRPGFLAGRRVRRLRRW